MRVAGVALLVLLGGILMVWMSRPSGVVRVPKAPQLGMPADGTARAPVSSGFGLGGGGLSGLAKGAPRSSDGGSTFPVRAQEPATYTAMPGEGPISESGPGSVTELYPPSRVTYITTSSEMPEVQEPTGQSTRITSVTEADRPAPRADPETPKGRDRLLDAAIEGGLGGGGKSDGRDVPGQIR